MSSSGQSVSSWSLVWVIASPRVMVWLSCPSIRYKVAEVQLDIASWTTSMLPVTVSDVMLLLAVTEYEYVPYASWETVPWTSAQQVSLFTIDIPGGNPEAVIIKLSVQVVENSKAMGAIS